MKSRISLVALMATIPLLFGAPPPASAASPEQELLAAVKTGPYARIGPWLANLYQEFEQLDARNNDRARNNGRARNDGRQDAFQTNNPALRVNNGAIAIDAFAADPVAFRLDLESLGATDILGVGSLFSARVPVSMLGELAALDSLKFAGPVMAKTRAHQFDANGLVLSQGDLAMGGPDARFNASVDGTGQRVGILSDSYQCNPGAFFAGQPTSTAAEDETSGEVDPDLVLLDNGPCPGTDEGRAIAQLARDVAPGAGQAYHTAFNSRLDFALGILELGGVDTNLNNFLLNPYPIIPEADRSTVIIDDVIYFAEPMFSDGMVGQAADLVAEAGIPYFSSAGNNARASYESEFRGIDHRGNFGKNLNRGKKDGPNVTRFHDFDPGEGVDKLQTIHLFASGGAAFIVYSFQWDQPHASATQFANIVQNNDPTAPNTASSDLDMVFYDMNGILLPLCPPGVALNITCQITGDSNIGGNAVDIAAVFYADPNPTGAGPGAHATFQVGFVVSEGTDPGHVKYVSFDFQGTVAIAEHDTKSGTAYGHANAAGAESVAAAAFYFTEAFDGDPAIITRVPAGICLEDGSAGCLEDFSSAGSIPVFLDALGNRIPEELRINPGVTGPDGGNTTFFFADSSFDDDDHDGYNNPLSTFVTPLDTDGGEWPNFFGTSASAPHVAAVAALMLEKAEVLGVSLSAQDVYDILRDTARSVNLRRLDFNGPGGTLRTTSFPSDPDGFNDDAGFGLVDAVAALDAVEALATP